MMNKCFTVKMSNMPSLYKWIQKTGQTEKVFAQEEIFKLDHI